MHKVKTKHEAEQQYDEVKTEHESEQLYMKSKLNTNLSKYAQSQN
jgi:hypothetical protein